MPLIVSAEEANVLYTRCNQLHSRLYRVIEKVPLTPLRGAIPALC